MIIASGTEGDRELLLLGLSRANVDALVAGKPIKMTPHSHPGMPKGLTICIMFGETEQAMHDELKGLGALEGAIVKKDQRVN